MSTERDSNLGESFSQYFELVPALDDASRDEVYRIRHEVYCRDLGWEPLREDGMERDIYDSQSVHCLMRRRGGGELVGCTRLILTHPLDQTQLLPFEQSCAEVLDRSICDPAWLPRQCVAEVSRLAVMRNFRQRKGESESPVALSTEDFEPRGPRSRFPFIPVGLYLGAAAIAHRLARDYVFVLTEPRLATHFTRIGFDIQTVGGTIEHRGQRAPSLLRASKVIEGLRPMIRPLYEVIEAGIESAYLASGRKNS